jgi:calmodulin
MSFAHTSSRESRAADRMDGFIELLVKGGIERAAVDEWLEAFKAFDADGDGTCSVKELGTVMRCLGIKMTEAQVQDLVTEFDANGSGTIDNLEFLMMMQRYASTPQNEAARVKEAFKIFDKDHSGLVSADELRNVMHNVGENLSDAELRSMILVADQHGDGEISLEDFEAMMSTDADSHRLAPVTTDEEVRAQRVSNVRRQFERLAPHEAAPSQDQIVHALRQSDYHAGMAVSQLLVRPSPPERCRCSVC